jgi:hypothetical protein
MHPSPLLCNVLLKPDHSCRKHWTSMFRLDDNISEVWTCAENQTRLHVNNRPCRTHGDFETKFLYDFGTTDQALPVLLICWTYVQTVGMVVFRNIMIIPGIRSLTKEKSQVRSSRLCVVASDPLEDKALRVRLVSAPDND